MKKIQSLKGKKAFKVVFKKGRRYRSDYMELFVLKEIQNKDNKIFFNRKDYNSQTKLYAGIQIGRKYGNAVKRNRIRRQIKAIFNELSGENSEEIYVIIRPTSSVIKSLNFTDLMNDMASLMKKAEICL